MTEKELVEMMYQKHQKLLLDTKEAPYEWGSSYSALSKLFGEKSAISEKMIREQKLIPNWTQFGKKRMWKLTEIANWILNTEKEKN